MTQFQIVIKLGNGQLSPSRPSDSGDTAHEHALWQLAERCWSSQPDSRPSAMQVAQEMDDLYRRSLSYQSDVPLGSTLDDTPKVYQEHNSQGDPPRLQISSASQAAAEFVREVLSNSFDDIVLDDSKNVLIVFYTPW
jgi:hypothetical protein